MLKEFELQRKKLEILNCNFFHQKDRKIQPLRFSKEMKYQFKYNNYKLWAQL